MKTTKSLFLVVLGIAMMLVTGCRKDNPTPPTPPPGPDPLPGVVEFEVADQGISNVTVSGNVLNYVSWTRFTDTYDDGTEKQREEKVSLNIEVKNPELMTALVNDFAGTTVTDIEVGSGGLNSEIEDGVYVISNYNGQISVVMGGYTLYFDATFQSAVHTSELGNTDMLAVTLDDLKIESGIPVITDMPDITDGDKSYEVKKLTLEITIRMGDSSAVIKPKAEVTMMRDKGYGSYIDGSEMVSRSVEDAGDMFMSKMTVKTNWSDGTSETNGYQASVWANGVNYMPGDVVASGTMSQVAYKSASLSKNEISVDVSGEYVYTHYMEGTVTLDYTAFTVDLKFESTEATYIDRTSEFDFINPELDLGNINIVDYNLLYEVEYEGQDVYTLMLKAEIPVKCGNLTKTMVCEYAGQVFFAK